MKDRKAYEAEHIERPVEYWRAKIYGDECSFDSSNRGTSCVTRVQGKWFHDDCIDYTFSSERISVMVYGAISHNWKSPLVFIEGSGARGGMTSQDYI